MKKFISTAMGAALLLVLAAMENHAGTNGFVVPSIRSLPGSTFSGWEVFTRGKELNNTPDLAGSAREAGLAQSETNGFVTGSGNIYNVSGTNAFRISYPSRAPIARVVLQARTLGAELDYNSVKIVFDEAGTRKTLATTRLELDRGTAQGVNVSSQWEWDLTGRGVTVFNIEFAAAGPSLSFDSAMLDVSKETLHLAQSRVDLDRWMYANNPTPGVRPSASTFAVFGEDGVGIDTRWAQCLFGWNTATGAAPVLAAQGPANYLVYKAGVTLTINRDRVWAYDGTHDRFETYLTDADARHIADADAGRPAELFGAGFRGGFTAATFPEAGPFGQDGIGTRNAYAAAFDAAGALIDISNNVGKRDQDTFEAKPFAVGVAPELAAGDLVPTGTRLSFTVDLSDPNILGYFQSSLDAGALRLTVSSLVNASFSTPNYPQFYTKENTLANTNEIPLLDLICQIAKPEPALQVSRGANGRAFLTWPTSPERYEVQVAQSLAANAEWLPVTGAQVTAGNTVTLEVDSSQSAGFFRLHRVL